MIVGPLVTVLILHILQNDEIRELIPNRWIRELATGLFLTGLLLLGAVFAATGWAASSLSKWYPLLTLLLLSSGIATLILTATTLPALVISGVIDFEGEQITLDEVEEETQEETTDNVNGKEQDLGE